MKKIVLIFMALLLSAQFTACGGTTTETASETNAITETQPAETEPETLALTLEAEDYEGHIIKYLTGLEYSGRFYLLMEEGSGDVLSDAAYKRNLAVSELLNVGFDSAEVDPSVVGTTLTASVMAGDNEYDYVLPHPTLGVTAMVTDGALLDWNTLDHVSFDKPWWNANMLKSLSVGGKVYYAACDLVMTWQGMGAYLFNKEYLADYNLDTDMYEYVYDGTWTVDKMLSLTKDMYMDLDGDGKASASDQYGLLANLGGTYWYQFGCDQPISRIGDDGCPVLDMGTERMIRVVETYHEMLYATDTWRDSFSSSSYPTSSFRDMLISGRSFLTWFDIGGLHSYLREIEFEFGLLPMVKLDEAQDGYYSFCGAGLIGVPKTSPDPDRSAKVAEALAYYSYTILRPAFFDTVLQNKLLRDEDSYNMLSMMHDNKVFDFGFNFDGTAAEALNTVVVQKKSTDFVSYYAGIENKVNNNFRAIFEAAQENE